MKAIFKSKYFSLYLENGIGITFGVNFEVPYISIALIFFNATFSIPLRVNYENCTYGIVMAESAIFVYKGVFDVYCYCIPVFSIYQHEEAVLLKDGSWGSYGKASTMRERIDEFKTCDYEFQRCGKTVKGKYTMRRIDIRRKWLGWLPFLSQKRYAVQLFCDDGKNLYFPMKKGYTAIQCLDEACGKR